MTRIVVVKKADQTAFAPEVLTFTRVKHLRIWMSREKLTAPFIGDQEDRRFLLSPSGERVWKVVEFENDNCWNPKVRAKNAQTFPAFFQDWEEVHVKGRK
jgi:hypothetical protein